MSIPAPPLSLPACTRAASAAPGFSRSWLGAFAADYHWLATAHDRGERLRERRRHMYEIVLWATDASPVSDGALTEAVKLLQPGGRRSRSLRRTVHRWSLGRPAGPRRRVRSPQGARQQGRAAEGRRHRRRVDRRDDPPQHGGRDRKGRGGLQRRRDRMRDPRFRRRCRRRRRATSRCACRTASCPVIVVSRSRPRAQCSRRGRSSGVGAALATRRLRSHPQWQRRSRSSTCTSSAAGERRSPTCRSRSPRVA